MRPIVEGVERMLPEGAWPVWTGSNHDGRRFATRWAGGDPARTRAALMVLLGLRGTPFLYYGDEIGLPDTPLDPADALDPVAARLGDPGENRDVCRTPMQWADVPGGGFTSDGARPWLPFGDLAAHNVEAQREDPGSVLHLVRDLIALRRSRSDLREGTYETLAAPEGAWAWRRGQGTAVAVNLGDAPVSVGGLTGRVLVGTDRGRDGSEVSGALELAPGEGAVLELS
jgi:alpha-glucosidase